MDAAGGGEAKADETYGQLYDALLKSVERTIKDQDLSSVTFIWMQGEADAGSGWGAVYEASFLGVLDQLKTDLRIDEIHFVLGRINDYWLPENGTKDGDLVREVQKKLGEENANGDWVNTDDLNRGINPWGLYEINSGHFPPAAYRVLGQRFARKACLLINPKPELDETIFDAVFFDSSEDIASHNAVGKKVNGTKPDSGDWAGLVDGKFGTDDAGDSAWLGFSPTEDGIEFVVDLGAEQEISALGINLLFSREAKALFPEKITLLTSMDSGDYKPAHSRGIGFVYTNAKKAKLFDGLKPESHLLLWEPIKTKARYIKVQVKMGETSNLFVDEIIVNPSAKQ